MSGLGFRGPYTPLTTRRGDERRSTLEAKGGANGFRSLEATLQNPQAMEST